MKTLAERLTAAREKMGWTQPELFCNTAKLDAAARTAILDASEQMVATEKTISPEEAEALAYLRKRIGHPDPISK